MVRHAYIYNQVLRIYQDMDCIRFPIDPDKIIQSIPNCKLMTYAQFAKINHCTIEDVIAACESNSGCTHYDASCNRYLILWNSEDTHRNVDGRRRWTKAHELGHVTLRHMQSMTTTIAAEHSLSGKIIMPEFEAEADLFSATLLSPMPLFSTLNIQSYQDIKTVFGLSTEASVNRWNDYLRWMQSHRKTAWENDLKRCYLRKRNIP